MCWYSGSYNEVRWRIGNPASPPHGNDIGLPNTVMLLISSVSLILMLQDRSYDTTEGIGLGLKEA